MPHMLEIRTSPTHGRGVFTTERVHAGEVLEVAPVLPFDRKDTRRIDATALSQYVFDWGDDRTAVAFGYVSLCNHGMPPNAEVEVAEDPPTITLTACRDIPAGTEILVDYGEDHPVDSTA